MFHSLLLPLGFCALLPPSYGWDRATQGSIHSPLALRQIHLLGIFVPFPLEARKKHSMNGRKYTVRLAFFCPRLHCSPLTRAFLGDVIHLRCLGRSMIVLDSAEAVNDLLDKRSSNYSSRPDFVVLKMLVNLIKSSIGGVLYFL